MSLKPGKCVKETINVIHLVTSSDAIFTINNFCTTNLYSIEYTPIQCPMDVEFDDEDYWHQFQEMVDEVIAESIKQTEIECLLFLIVIDPEIFNDSIKSCCAIVLNQIPKELKIQKRVQIYYFNLSFANNFPIDLYSEDYKFKYIETREDEETSKCASWFQSYLEDIEKTKNDLIEKFNSHYSNIQSDALCTATGLKRTLFLPHLLLSLKSVFTFPDDCQSIDLKSYDILYTPLVCTADEDIVSDYVKKIIIKSSEVTDMCISILILIDKTCTPVVLDALNILVDLLPINLQVNTSIYCFALNEDITIPRNMKFLFVQYDKDSEVGYKQRINYITLGQKKVQTLVINSEANNYIDCSPWFEYYLANAFKCATGRLRQNSNTCYLNAAINVFLLTRVLKTAIMQYIHSLPDESPEKAEIMKPLSKDPQQCSFFSQIYVLQVIYNSACQKLLFSEKFEKSDDIIINYSQKFFTGEGGSGEAAFSQILSFLPENISSNIIIVEDFYDYLNLFIPRQLEKDNKTYQLVACIITFNGYKGDQTFTHVITGYLCNGIPKVYDSNNYMFNFDWVSLENLAEFEQELNSVYMADSDRVNIIYMVPIYVSKIWKDTLSSQPLMC